MHVIRTDPRRTLMAAMAALVLALAAAALMTVLGSMSFGTVDPPPAVAQPSNAGGAPAWVERPLASPVAELRVSGSSGS